MTPIDSYLADLVDQAGVTIEYKRLRDGRDGESYVDRKLTRLRPGMNARLHRCVLAHELGHHAFGHHSTRFGPVHAKQERAAEEWGALRLISLDDYRHVEEIHDGHAGAMALELGVMRSTLAAFQGLLLRTDQHVYLDPRLGTRQWARRTHVA
ncbi:ImmA/IrrE family metallo-endopeptidase [Microbacterium sp. 22242]|uniref:ImmA/IrrE family metallo-endopeptidase n=1 Tax=Microbacterium sp. 22242 TaxID=3453896 RepID=UPI003F874FD4